MTISEKKEKALGILKSVWSRRDGSKWQNVSEPPDYGHTKPGRRESDPYLSRALNPDPDQQTKPGERDKELSDNKLIDWAKKSREKGNSNSDSDKTLFIQTPRSSFAPGSRVLGLAHEGDSLKLEDEHDNSKSQSEKDIEKSLLGFGKKPSSDGKVGLIKKVIVDKNGRRQTKWVRPEEVVTPKEKKQAEAKAQRKQFRDLPKHSTEDQKKVEDILQRHKSFEEKAKEQRRVYGSDPMLPKPGLIMRVYAQGKVNVGGMLAEIKQVANDGKTVIAQLTSGKTYSFPLDQLQFAKSSLHYEIGKKGGIIIGRDKLGKPIYGDPYQNQQYNHIVIHETNTLSQAVGFQVSKISYNANFLAKKHPEHFKHPEQVKKLIEFVVSNPTHFLPATHNKHTLVVSVQSNKALVIEIVPNSKTKYSVVRSAFILGEDQLKIKLQKLREHQVGSQVPQFLGDDIKKSNAYTTKVLDSLTSNRSGAISYSRLQKNISQLKKVALSYEVIE